MRCGPCRSRAEARKRGHVELRRVCRPAAVVSAPGHRRRPGAGFDPGPASVAASRQRPDPQPEQRTPCCRRPSAASCAACARLLAAADLCTGTAPGSRGPAAAEPAACAPADAGSGSGHASVAPVRAAGLDHTPSSTDAASVCADDPTSGPPADARAGHAPAAPHRAARLDGSDTGTPAVASCEPSARFPAHRTLADRADADCAAASSRDAACRSDAGAGADTPAQRTGRAAPRSKPGTLDRARLRA